MFWYSCKSTPVCSTHVFRSGSTPVMGGGLVARLCWPSRFASAMLPNANPLCIVCDRVARWYPAGAGPSLCQSCCLMCALYLPGHVWTNICTSTTFWFKARAYPFLKHSLCVPNTSRPPFAFSERENSLFPQYTISGTPSLVIRNEPLPARVPPRAQPPMQALRQKGARAFARDPAPMPKMWHRVRPNRSVSPYQISLQGQSKSEATLLLKKSLPDLQETRTSQQFCSPRQHALQKEDDQMNLLFKSPTLFNADTADPGNQRCNSA